MPYCPRCGVEIEDRLTSCPLCDTYIPQEVRDLDNIQRDYPEDVVKPKPMYRELTKKEKRFLITGLIAFIGLFPIAISIGLDLLQHRAITWSFFVTVPMIGSMLISWFFYRFGKRPLISVTVCLLILFIINLLIEMRTETYLGFLSGSMNFFLLIFLIIEILLFYIVKRRPNVLQLLGAIFLDTALICMGLNWFISSNLTWSLIILVCNTGITVYLSYMNRTKKRGLNIIGFLFFDIAVFLWCLELVISGKMNWSIVTTLIFIPISLLFYVLHITLFNDTDWKKALHL